VNTLWSMMLRLAPGRLYVFRPMASRYRYKKIVKCPEADQPAEILVDASPSSSSKPKKKSFSIRNCSLWPKRKGCTESCLK
jgi:hypothetical protein